MAGSKRRARGEGRCTGETEVQMHKSGSMHLNISLVKGESRLLQSVIRRFRQERSQRNEVNHCSPLCNRTNGRMKVSR